MIKKVVMIVGVGILTLLLVALAFHAIVSPAIPYSTSSDGSIVHK